MDCPVCKVVMIVLELNEVEIDYCLTCKGIWLDSGELELLLNESENKELFLNSLHEANNSAEKKKKCPLCGKNMKKVFLGSDNKVLIDKCKKNHGIWFDTGELQQALQMAGTGADSEVLKHLNLIFGKEIN